MITVSGVPFDITTLTQGGRANGMERQLLTAMADSGETYAYDHIRQLEFTLRLREEIVKAAIELDQSRLVFSDFTDSRCNPRYWNRTEEGGFTLQDGVKANEAIDDIFTNGSAYATECATAMVIVYYKALLAVFGKELFNRLFPHIEFMGWNITEPLLEAVAQPIKTETFLPGDRGYFSNPDVNPETPAWQGENVIVLPDALYYGHGIGIATAETMIKRLNTKRKEGATKSAYWRGEAGRPDFKALSHVFDRSRPTGPLVWKPFPTPATFV